MFGWLKRAQRAASKVDSIRVVAAGRFVPPRRGTAEMLVAYKESPWLRAVVSKIASSAAAVEWHVYKQGSNGQREPLPKHEIRDFLNAGNVFMPGYLVRRLTFAHLDLVGEAFWAIERGKGNKPAKVLNLAPHWVASLPTANHDFFKVNIPGGFIGEVATSEIIYFRDPDVYHPYERGQGIASALSDELNVDEYAAKYISALFANRARPDVIITGTKEAPLSKEDADRFEEVWLSKFGGVTKQGKPFFSKGAVEVKELGQTMKDLQSIELRQFERDTFINVYGVPPEKLGITENSNRANIEGADLIWASEVLVPRLTMMREVLRHRLASEFEDAQDLDYESPVREDREFKLKVIQVAPWAFKVNDVRKLAGEPPLEGKDGDKFAVQVGVRFVDELGAELPEQPMEGDGTEDEETEEPKAKSLIKADFTTDQVVAVAETLDDPQVVGAVSKMWNPILWDLTKQFGHEAMAEIGAEIAVDNLEAIETYAQQRSSALIKNINDTTREAIRTTLAEGVKNGETLEQLTARVNAAFQEASRTRSEVIAMTESTASASAGYEASFAAAGIEKMVWLTTRDSRVRPSHKSAEGQVQPVGGSFKVGGATGPGPGRMSTAKESVRCRCAIRAFLPGVDDTKAMSEAELKALWETREAKRQVAQDRLVDVVRDTFNLQRAAVVKRLREIGNA